MDKGKNTPRCRLFWTSQWLVGVEQGRNCSSKDEAAAGAQRVVESGLLACTERSTAATQCPCPTTQACRHGTGNCRRRSAQYKKGNRWTHGDGVLALVGHPEPNGRFCVTKARVQQEDYCTVQSALTDSLPRASACPPALGAEGHRGLQCSSHHQDRLHTLPHHRQENMGRRERLCVYPASRCA